MIVLANNAKNVDTILLVIFIAPVQLQAAGTNMEYRHA